MNVRLLVSKLFWVLKSRIRDDPGDFLSSQREGTGGWLILNLGYSG